GSRNVALTLSRMTREHLKSDAQYRLRSSATEDREILWLWANDAQTRRSSIDPSAIPWNDHVDWFERQRTSDNAILLIAENAAAQSVGSIRFDTRDGWCSARVSY